MWAFRVISSTERRLTGAVGLQGVFAVQPLRRDRLLSGLVSKATTPGTADNSGAQNSQPPVHTGPLPLSATGLFRLCVR